MAKAKKAVAKKKKNVASKTAKAKPGKMGAGKANGG